MNRVATGIVVVALLGLGACGSSTRAPGPGTAKNTTKSTVPTLRVVTGLYPLAQVAARIGAGHVAVTDVVPPGADPRRYQLNQAQVAQIDSADLVLVEGGGFQPSIEAAAAHLRSARVVSLAAGLSGAASYPWLEPETMVDAVKLVASAMETADPAASGSFRNGEEALTAELHSTAIDYQSTLSTCPRTTIFTPDLAFAQVAKRYAIHNELVSSGAASVRASGVTTIFSETFESPAQDAAVSAVAAAAAVRVRSLDTLTGPPPQGWPPQANYINLLEANLGVLAAALGCPTNGA